MCLKRSLTHCELNLMWLSLLVRTSALWKRNDRLCRPHVRRRMVVTLARKSGEVAYVNGKDEYAIDGCNVHVKEFVPRDWVLVPHEI